jgi:hypothetical protein
MSTDRPVTRYERRIVDPATDQSWETLMRTPSGSLFGSPPWMRALRDSYPFDFAAAVLFEDGSSVAGLTYCNIDDLKGRRITSLPFVDRVDPVAADQAQYAALVDPVLAVGVPVTLRCLDSALPRADPRFVETGRLAWHATDTSRTPDAMLASFATAARANIRAGDRRGVRVRIGRELRDVQRFHALHCVTRKYKYRLLPQAIGFFEAIWHHFAPTGDIHVALATDTDGVDIGGAMYLRWNDVLYYKFGASALSQLTLRPNEAVHWAGLRLAHELGCTSLDWGVSDLDQPGLVSYKRKYATTEGTVRVLRHQPSGKDAPQPDLSWLGELTALLTRDDVADDVTKAAGEILYRFFA